MPTCAHPACSSVVVTVIVHRSGSGEISWDGNFTGKRLSPVVPSRDTGDRRNRQFPVAARSTEAAAKRLASFAMLTAG